MARSLTALRDELNHKRHCLKDIVDRAEKESRVMTVDENALFDKLDAEITTVENEITQILETDKRREKLDTINARLSQGRRETAVEKPAAPSLTNSNEIPNYRRDGALRAFKGDTRREAEAKAYRCGMWARAVLFNDQKAAFWVSNNMGLDVRNALGENVNTAGGYLVPEEFSQTVIDLREQYGVFRQQCRVVPMGRDTMLIPRRASGVTVGFIGENPSSAMSQSQPAWNQVRLTAKKIGGLTLMSTEVAEDAVISLGDWLAQEFAYGFALLEDQCGFIGDGTSTYGGIRGLGNIFTTTGGVGGGQLVGAVDLASNHDTFAEVDYADLQTVMAKLPQYARMNAKWYCSQVCMDLVFGRIMANAGGNTIQNMQGGYGPSYMGYPIVISQVLPTSTGDLSDVPMFYFGDLSLAATMGDRRGVSVFPSEHRYMDTDQIGVRATERFDIVVHDVGDTTTGNAGPIVAAVGE